MTCGVPLGTVLGPLLFLIYMNELFNFGLCSETIAYADDTVLFLEGESWDGIVEKAATDLRRLKSWLNKNKLSLNTDKSHFMTFTSYSTYLPDINELVFHCDDCR